MQQLSKQRGAAIIVALFVMSIVAVISVMLMSRLLMDVEHTALWLRDAQNGFSVSGSVDWARETLGNDWRRRVPNQVIDRTPIKSPVDQENHQLISSEIEDAQGRFNVNNLVDTKSQEQFVRLLKTIAPTLSDAIAQNITDAISNWISPSGDNKQDDYYAKCHPPYRAAHRLMASISELRLVQGMTRDLFLALSPYVTALPESLTPININNASIPVLMSLDPSFTLDTADGIVKRVKTLPFVCVADFAALDFMKTHPVQTERLTVESHYFLVKTNVFTAKLDDSERVFYTLIQRKEQNGRSEQMMVWQSIGVP